MKQRTAKAATVPLGSLAVISLFLMRWLLPTEAPERGLTLWIAALWFLVWGIRSYLAWRNDPQKTWNVSWLDVAVAALIGGHLLSGGIVLITSGHKRAALNLMWEWASLGILYVEFKRLLQHTAARRLFLSGMLVTGVSLAGLGLWQHFVWYRLQAEEVTELLELHDQQSSQLLSAEERARYQQLSREHGAEVLSLDATGRTMFLARVSESLEPIGRFALANTLGGLLAVLCLLCGGQIITTWNAQLHVSKTISLGILTLLLTTLLLTKSRTALIGFLFGCSCYLLATNLRKRISRKVGRGIGVGALVLLLIVAGLFLSGGLDIEVLSEAPKSLQYRGEYWAGTLHLLRDHPVFGVGPGNFRQHYLQYKLPGSSEEILDPHNLVLDVWANGGLLSLVGLLLAAGIVVLQHFRYGTQPAGTPQATPTIPLSRLSLLKVGLLTGGVVLGYEYLIMGIADTTLFWLTCLWCVVAALLQPLFKELDNSPVIAASAWAALGLHLCGAGGIGMPAITQIFLILMLLAVPQLPARWPWTLPSLTELAIATVGLLGIIYTAVVPHIMTSHLLEVGQYELTVQHQPSRAEKTFQAAIRYDHLNPEIIEQLAMAKMTRWLATGKRNEELFREVNTYQRHAITMDPNAPNRYRTLGEMLEKKLEFAPEPGLINSVAKAFGHAALHYPASSILQAKAALAYAQIPEGARTANMYAQKALELDALNQQRGHTDKLLTAQMIEDLQRIVYENGQ